MRRDKEREILLLVKGKRNLFLIRSFKIQDRIDNWKQTNYCITKEKERSKEEKKN